MAKFQGDRSREIGASVAKQKKHLGQNISPSGTDRSGRPNKNKRSGGMESVLDPKTGRSENCAVKTMTSNHEDDG